MMHGPMNISYLSCYLQSNEIRGNNFDELKRILGWVKQYFLILLMKSKLFCMKLQKSRMIINPLQMVMRLKEV